MPFVKPLDGAGLAQSVSKTGRLVTVEEHNVVGGFGSACLESLAPRKLTFDYVPVGVQDTFTETGAYDELLAAYGLSASGIVGKVDGLMKKN